jgi:hypothetical protein
MLAGGDFEGVPGEDFNRSLECHSDMETVLVVEPGCTRTATPQQKRRKKFVLDKEQLRDAIFTTAHHSSNFILDIVLRAVRLMRIPLSILLFLILDIVLRAIRLMRITLSILLFLLMLPFVITCISAALRPGFAPICNFPFISRFPLCVLPEPTSTIHEPAYFPRLMQVESSKFKQLLDGSTRRTELFFNLRQAESAPVDLVIIIQHSSLETDVDGCGHERFTGHGSHSC